jgi:predicted permease
LKIRVVLIGAALCAALLAAGTVRAAPVTADTANPFDGAGVFIDNIGDFPGPFALADELQKDHFTWVAFHVHNGIWMQ